MFVLTPSTKLTFARVLISSRQEKNIIDRTTGSEYCTFCVWRQIFKELAKEMNQEAGYFVFLCYDE